VLSEVQAICSRIILLHQGRVLADDTPQHLGAALRNSGSYVAGVEGDRAAVLRVLAGVPGVLELTPGPRESELVGEYGIRGAPDRDIRRDVSLALSGAGLILLGTRYADVSLEQVFLALIRGDNGGTDDSGT
jgi:ABC-2 type transport system ATP-binding protein